MKEKIRIKVVSFYEGILGKDDESLRQLRFTCRTMYITLNGNKIVKNILLC